MTKLEERDVSPEDLPEGRIVPGDARWSEFCTRFLLCKCGHHFYRHGRDEPVTTGSVTRHSYNCSDCDCQRAERTETVSDTRTVDDLMHQEVQHMTTRGQRQEGVVFVCQEHGVQPFGAFYHPPAYQPALELGCGCIFFARESGELARLKGGLDRQPRQGCGHPLNVHGWCVTCGSYA